MDEDYDVGTQYIICECGDNFPNEKLLNIHLARRHGYVETFQCESCPELFTSEPLYQQHISKHKIQKLKKKLTNIHGVKTHAKKDLHDAVKQERQEVITNEDLQQRTERKTQKKTPNIHELKTYSKKEPTVKVPPVIKVQNLKRIDSVSLINNLRRIDSISLMQNLKDYSSRVKIQSPPTPEPPEPEPEPEMVVMESVMEVPVVVKHEVEQEEDVNEEIYYQCDVCNTVFYTEEEFDVHYQSTHAMKTEVTAEEILEDHLVSDHIDNVGIKAEVDAVETAYYFECEMCHKIFASEEYFNRHYNQVHGGLLAMTDVSVQQIEQTQEELAEEPETEAQDYSVEEYKPTEVCVAEEPETKAQDQVIYYKCDLCKILYPSERAYNSHFDKKHGGGAPAQGSVGFRFIEQDLARPYPPPAPHAPRAEDVFTCEFCPKSFNLKRSLQVHRKRVHTDRAGAAAAAAARGPRPPSRSKVCDVCGRAYNSNAALRYHQRRHTGEKPYACTMCPKRFTMPMFLQIHLRTHTGEKPYECPQCPKAFTNKAALIRHDRVHTGLKPYPCPECGKFFTQSNSMKLHVSTVHLKLPAPYKSKNRRNKSEARALQLALKCLPTDIIEEDVIDD